MNKEKEAHLQNTIIRHLAGSKAYGTDHEKSDTDIRGIFCPSGREYATPFYTVGKLKLEDEEDGELQSIDKYLQLCLDQNPNIVETLWVDESSIVHVDEPYWLLREHNEALLSSKVAFTYSGYAMAQIKRIKSHKKWINNPKPVEPPPAHQFVKMINNFTPAKIMPRDFDIRDYGHLNMIHYQNNIYGLVEEGTTNVDVLDKHGDFNIAAKQEKVSDRAQPLFIIHYNVENHTREKDDHKNYWKWKKERNPARHELEEKYGYDTKNALHTVRLMNSAEEILTGQGVIVKRHDADFLKEILHGAMTYDELLAWAEAKDEHIRKVLYPKTALPKKADMKLATKLLIEIQDYYWLKNRSN